MYLVKNSKACGVIGIAPSASEPVSFAASELQRYIQQATGVFLPVCTEPRDNVALRIGIDERLADEEFEIVSKNDTAEILGGSGLGALYGVYHLLKHHCGIIFAGFGPEGEHVPHLDSVELPEGVERHKPLLWYRGTQFICVGEISEKESSAWREGAIRRVDWMAKNGMNFILNWPLDNRNVGTKNFKWKSETEYEWAYSEEPHWMTTEWFSQNVMPEIRKRGMKIEVGTHNMLMFLPPSVYFDEHPEYYALRDGKRSPKAVQLVICTSNSDAVEEYTANVLKYIEANPYIDVLGLAQEDGFGMCECEECRKLDNPDYDAPGREVKGEFMNGLVWEYSEHRNKTRRYFQLVNQVARRIKERFPEKNLKINACCYVDMAWPPVDIEIEDNIYPHVAMYIRCASHDYNDRSCPINSALSEVIQAWSKAAPGRVYVTEYYNGKSAYRSMPYPIAHRVAEDWRYFAQLGIGGMKNQHTVACNEAYALNTYTFARRAWDMDEPFEKILNDFLLGRFAGKAEKVKPIYQAAMKKMDDLGKSGTCYHPDSDIFLAVFTSEDVQWAVDILNSVLAEKCTPREQVQLNRLMIVLEFVERFRELTDAIRKVQKEQGISCDKTTYDKVMDFLDWEKQYIRTGCFAWGNDIYQWKNAVQGLIGAITK